MKNKKAQIDPRLIIVAIVVIIYFGIGQTGSFYPSGLELSSVSQLAEDDVSQTFQMDWSASNYREEKYGCAEFEVPSSYDNDRVPEFHGLQENEWFKAYDAGVQMQGGRQPASEKAFCKVKKIPRGADTPRAFLTCKYKGCWDVQYTYENFGVEAHLGMKGLKEGYFKVRIPKEGIDCFDDTGCTAIEKCELNICISKSLPKEDIPENDGIIIIIPETTDIPNIKEETKEIGCRQNIDCISICGDKIPTCISESCRCDNKIVKVNKKSFMDKFNDWFQNLIDFIFG